MENKFILLLNIKNQFIPLIDFILEMRGGGDYLYFIDPQIHSIKCSKIGQGGI